MTMLYCTIPDCSRPLYQRGYCGTHLTRVKRGTDLTKPVQIRGDDKARFFQYVHKTDTCWSWTGALSKFGYGKFMSNHKDVRSHRFSFFLAHGYMPKLLVLHSCDVRHCVNPEHLREGSHKENAADMFIRGRNKNQSGEKSHFAKLTETDIRNIKKLLAQGVLQRVIAKQFGVSQPNICLINQGINWSHIT